MARIQLIPSVEPIFGNIFVLCLAGGQKIYVGSITTMQFARYGLIEVILYLSGRVSVWCWVGGCLD